MIIFPAIDIQNGECVRLTKGDFATAERVAEDPLQTALSFQEAGAEWIHMVDLDGAKTAQTVNRSVFLAVAKETKLKVEVGGGIRDVKTAEYYLEHGVERVILGSAAVRNPKMVAELVREYGDRIVVGIDAENGIVKIDGWQNTGHVNFIALARTMEYIGVRHIIYTDISKDGTLSGPNLAELRRLRDSAHVNVIASGGIHNLDDITELGKLRLYGAICGKSLYHGTLDLREAIEEGAKYTPVEIPDPEELEAAEEAAYQEAENRKAKAQQQRSSNGGRARSERPQPGEESRSSKNTDGRRERQSGNPSRNRPSGNATKNSAGGPGGEGKRDPSRTEPKEKKPRTDSGSAPRREGKPQGGKAAENSGGKPDARMPSASGEDGRAPGRSRPRHRSRGRRGGGKGTGSPKQAAEGTPAKQGEK